MSTEPSPVEVLNDIPADRWDSLARGVRRAVDQLDGARVPKGLRPFSTFKPEALRDAAHARRAVAEALVADARFREAVGAAVGGDDRRAHAREVDPLALRGELGADQAVALLAVTGRWDALVTLAAALADERAARGLAAAEQAPGTDAGARERELRAARDEVRGLRRQLQDAQRREAELRRLVQQLVGERDAAQADAEQEREDRRQLARLLDTERAEHRGRLARARRGAAEARRWAAASDERTTAIVRELAELSARLQSPLGDGRDAASDDDGDGDDDDVADTAAQVPRAVRAATAGRPVRLPPGVDPESATAVLALLQVPGLRLFIDGYNVTKDARGVPGMALEEQRRWLVRLVNGVVARYDVRPTLVFDGRADIGGAVPRARGVMVCFATDGTADEMLADLLAGLDDDVPALVVSSDREVRAAAAVRQANSVAADRFIAATTG